MLEPTALEPTTQQKSVTRSIRMAGEWRSGEWGCHKKAQKAQNPQPHPLSSAEWRKGPGRRSSLFGAPLSSILSPLVPLPARNEWGEEEKNAEAEARGRRPWLVCSVFSPLLFALVPLLFNHRILKTSCLTTRSRSNKGEQTERSSHSTEDRPTSASTSFLCFSVVQTRPSTQGWFQTTNLR